MVNMAETGPIAKAFSSSPTAAKPKTKDSILMLAKRKGASRFIIIRLK